MNKSDELDCPLPLTGVCIVADKSKCPAGFTPIVKTADDNSDADVWRESSFSIFARPTRYIAYSREICKEYVEISTVSVITDLIVIKDSDPIPHGYVSIDYTADTREKSLRKKYLCLKTEPRDAVVDAVGSISIMAKSKQTPKGFSSAGEIDGFRIIFKVVVIPPTFGMKHSISVPSLPARSAPDPPGRAPTVYPRLQSLNSTPNFDKVNDFTIKNISVIKPKGVDGVPFKLHPSVTMGKTKDNDNLPQIDFDVRLLSTEAFQYSFAVEQATLDHVN